MGPEAQGVGVLALRRAGQGDHAMSKATLTPEQRLDDALADTETFLDSAAHELEVALTYMKQARRLMRSRRMSIARRLKRTR